MDEYTNYGLSKKVGDIVEGEIIEINERGATLSIEGCLGIDAYIFNDNFSRNPNETIQNSLKLGDKIEVKIMKINLEESNFILVSRLPLLEKKDRELAKKAYTNHENINVKISKAIGDKGVCANYNGCEVFIPVSLLDIKGNINPSDYVGQTLTIRLIEVKLDYGRERYVGSRKIVLKNEAFEARNKELANLHEGDTIKGTIASFEKFGIFVKFGLLQGLLRFSQVTHSRHEKPEDILSVGEEVELKILKIDGTKIDLSRKALLPTPFSIYAKSHSISTVVKGKVIQKLAFGLIIELASDVSGLLHQSEYSWNPNDNLASCLRIGDEIETVIIGINHKDERISLSRKQMFDNPWARVDANRGDIIDVEVLSITPGKNLVVLALGVEGTININELSIDKISKIEDFFAKGDKLKAIVKNINKNTWTLELSIRELKEKEAKIEYEKYMSGQTEDTKDATVGEILGIKYKK